MTPHRATRRHGHPRHRPVLLGLLALGLAGCAADGSSPLNRLTAGGATAASPPAADGASAPVRPGAGRPPSAAASAALAGPALKIGNKNIDPSAVVLDPKCETLVEPFELTDNFSELTSLGLGMLGDNAAAIAGNSIQKLTGQATGAAKPPVKLRHNISATVRRAAVRMNWLPMTLEVMYGEHLLDDMKDGLLPRTGRIGPALYAKGDALLAEVLAAVTEPHAYQFRLHISTRSGDNAMALPGGLIVIDKALVEKPELRDKAYFALAHEVAHVLQRHETRSVQARIVDTVSLSSAKGDLVKTMQQANREPAAVVALVLTGKLLFEKHFVNQELQSDACAVRLLDRTLADKRRVRASIQAFVDGLPPSTDKPAPGRPRPDPVVPAGNALLQPGTADAAGDLVELVTRPIDRHPSTEARVQNLNTMLRAIELPPARAGNAGAAGAPVGAAARPAAPRASAPRPAAAASAAGNRAR